MIKYEKKDTRDVKKEYGYILRWIHDTADESGTIREGAVWLENCNDESDRIYIEEFSKGILDQKAYDYICEKTLLAFRDKINFNAYKTYLELFEIMGIKPLKTFADLMQEKGYNSNKLSVKANVPTSTIRDMKNGLSEFKGCKLENAMKIAKVFDMTVYEIFDYLYKANI